MPDSDLIAQAVARSASLAEVQLGAGVLTEASAMFRRHFGHGPALLVADDRIWAAAGPAVAAALQAEGIATDELILLANPRPKASVETATGIVSWLARAPGRPVAIGSGVINDLVKHAAFRLGRPYLAVATAASMDGFASVGAPLADRGFKITLPCRPPRAMLADLAVIAAARTPWPAGAMAIWRVKCLPGATG